MQPVDKLFTFEVSDVRAPFVDRIRRTWSEPFDGFIAAAQPQWEVVITRQGGRQQVDIRGPQTTASFSGIPQEAEFIAARFELGAFMPCLLPGQLLDGVLTLPNVGNRAFWFDGEQWETPTYHNIDVFVKKLAHRGLLAFDPLVRDAQQGSLQESMRTVQRRVQRATGLTLGMIRQINRAGKAAALLGQGGVIADTVQRAGYADHAHLTRSLRRFIGQTPSMLVKP